jgi:hypothetical protein
MKITLQQIMEIKETKQTKTIMKEIKSDFIPRIGDNIYDWIYLHPKSKNEEYKVTDVTIDYSENQVIVYIERMYIPDVETLETIKKQIEYRKNDWKLYL